MHLLSVNQIGKKSICIFCVVFCCFVDDSRQSYHCIILTPTNTVLKSGGCYPRYDVYFVFICFVYMFCMFFFHILKLNYTFMCFCFKSYREIIFNLSRASFNTKDTCTYFTTNNKMFFYIFSSELSLLINYICLFFKFLTLLFYLYIITAIILLKWRSIYTCICHHGIIYFNLEIYSRIE